MKAFTAMGLKLTLKDILPATYGIMLKHGPVILPSLAEKFIYQNCEKKSHVICAIHDSPAVCPPPKVTIFTGYPSLQP